MERWLTDWLHLRVPASGWDQGEGAGHRL